MSIPLPISNIYLYVLSPLPRLFSQQNHVLNIERWRHLLIPSKQRHQVSFSNRFSGNSHGRGGLLTVTAGIPLHLI